MSNRVLFVLAVMFLLLAFVVFCGCGTINGVTSDLSDLGDYVQRHTMTEQELQSFTDGYLADGQ